MFSRRFVSLTFLALALCLTGSQAFLSHASSVETKIVTSSTTLRMSSPPADDFGENMMMGPTERLLVERSFARKKGLVQEYGKTVKKDGLDGVRYVVWGIFHASQVVFSVMGVALVLGMALNAAGYAYYIDDMGFHVDTFQHLHQMQFLDAETARFATEENAWMR
eukprot:scaffold37865_cov199-Amphora_coffeaeformis.AAC.1